MNTTSQFQRPILMHGIRTVPRTARRQNFTPFARDAIEQSIPARRATGRARPRPARGKSGTEEISYGALDQSSNQIANAVLAACGQSLKQLRCSSNRGRRLGRRYWARLRLAKFRCRWTHRFRPRISEQIATQARADPDDRPVQRDCADPARELLSGQTLQPLQMFEIDAIGANASSHDPQVSVAPNASAYIFYTSG